MTSNINPNNINGAYPVAGQDNNSQGFRDNFTNTKTNFQSASEEITDLQNNAVLKSALQGQTLNNDMNGSILSNAQLQNMTQTVVNLGTLAGTVTINYALGSYQTVTTNGPISIALSNFHLGLGSLAVTNIVTVQITIASTAHTVQFPTAVSVNTLGIQGFNTSTNTLTVAAAGTYSFTLTTTNGGSTFTLDEGNKELRPFNNSSELLNDASGSNLALTTSYFSTVASSACSLAPGVAGQIKTFVMVVHGGDMVMTVANAGWKASGTGTITFNAIGNGCILQYVDSKWFCIGNNSVVLA
jgi:hypothetical protein